MILKLPGEKVDGVSKKGVGKKDMIELVSILFISWSFLLVSKVTLIYINLL